MASPYRESDDTPAAPLEELEWRRRVTRSALWAELLGAGDVIVLVATGWLPARFAVPGAVAWWVMSAGVAVRTWMWTAPQPRSAVGWRGWLLRGLVPLCLAVTGLLLLGVHLEMVSYILGAALMVAAIAYGWPFRRPQRGRWGPILAGLLGGVGSMVLSILPPILPAWRTFGVGFVLLAAAAPSALRRALLPVDYEWWFDNQTGTPGEWVALLVYRDGYAQLLFIDERPGWFASKDEATEWLQHEGYLHAERAIAERLVARVPPDVLPVARRRRRLRVEQSEPRVRVAADASSEAASYARVDAINQLDEDPTAETLDTAEPPRTLAVDRPHEY